jgi:hypothetical protein
MKGFVNENPGVRKVANPRAGNTCTHAFPNIRQ